MVLAPRLKTAGILTFYKELPVSSKFASCERKGEVQARCNGYEDIDQSQTTFGSYSGNHTKYLLFYIKRGQLVMHE